MKLNHQQNANNNTINNLFENETYFQLIIQFINLHGIFHGLFRLNKFVLKFLTSKSNQIILEIYLLMNLEIYTIYK